jgi:hypothetical protein
MVIRLYICVAEADAVVAVVVEYSVGWVIVVVVHKELLACRAACWPTLEVTVVGAEAVAEVEAEVVGVAN